MARVVLDSLNLREAERQLVAAALQYSETLVDAAERLGISYNALRYRMRKFELARDGLQRYRKVTPLCSAEVTPAV